MPGSNGWRREKARSCWVSLAPRSVAKEGGELAIPIAVPPLEVADALVELLRQLVD